MQDHILNMAVWHDRWDNSETYCLADFSYIFFMLSKEVLMVPSRHKVQLIKTDSKATVFFIEIHYMLCPVLVSSVQQRHVLTGARPAKGHKDEEGIGVYMRLWEVAKIIAQCGEVKTQGNLTSMYKFLTERVKEADSLRWYVDTGQWVQTERQEMQLKHKKKNFYRKGGQRMELVTQKDRTVSILGAILFRTWWDMVLSNCFSRSSRV